MTNVYKHNVEKNKLLSEISEIPVKVNREAQRQTEKTEEYDRSWIYN